MRRSILLLAALTIAATAGAQGGDIALVANGKTIQCDPAPTMHQGHVYVPLRAAAEAVGGDVEYDPAAKRVTICRGPMCTIVMQDEGLTVDDRLLVGIRQVGEALRARVDWDGDTRTVHITAN
ncbi:MAG: copper amine oxidase N-terminal domain-containing protein [Armatimonadota bacterium]